MDPPRFDTAAVVLGMHRSGTSALAGILGLTGFAAPHTLLLSSAVNERGFWESKRVNALNDELFAELGTTWHGLDPVSFAAHPDRLSQSARARAEETLVAEFEPGDSPLIKDPRLCRLLPFWKPAFAKLAARTVYAITLRSPLEVAQSLARRNDFDHDLGCLLWARYYLDAELHTRGLPRALLRYETLADDWRGDLHALGSVLGIEPNLDPAHEREVDVFLSADLRHHRMADDQAFIELERLPVVEQTYRALLEWGHAKPGSDPDFGAFDRAREHFDELSGTLSRVVENARLDRKRFANTKAQAEKVAAELGRARAAIENLDSLRVSLEVQSASQARLEERLSSAVDSLREAIQERGALEQLLADTRKEAKDRQSALKQALKASGEAQRALKSDVEQTRRQAEAAAQEHQRDRARLIDNFETMAGALRSELSSTAGALEEAIRERGALEQLLGETRSEAEDRQSALRLALEASEDELRALKSEVEHTRRQAEAAAENHQRDRAELIENFEKMVRTLKSEQDVGQAELKEVKRKYRSTQHQLSRDREKLRRTQERLAAVEANLAEVQQSGVWRTYITTRHALDQVTRLSLRAIGRGDRRWRSRKLALLRGSPLFDANWYVSRYPDVAAARVDAAVHYLENGWREGRDPSASFSTTSYLKSNPDVAGAGVNPLLHYIEFGYSDGRSISEVAAPSHRVRETPDEEFAAPAPCASFPVPKETPVRWRRSARLSEIPANLLVVRGIPIGVVADSAQRATINAGFARLAEISGFQNPESSDGTVGNFSNGPDELVDAWLVTKGRLRTRWRTERGPSVVRAYQHDPENAGSLRLVGEGLVASTLDFVDVNLANEYFPTLFVLGYPDGTVDGLELLAFPSLCRGGAHYSELLALEREQRSDQASVIGIVRSGETLGERLSAIVSGNTAPLVGRLFVDLAGADGTEHLFQPDFQAWLSKVLRIGMDPLDGHPEKRTGKYLAGIARTPDSERSGGGALTLAADAVPTISALVAPATVGEATVKEAILPLLVAKSDPAQPATWVKLPRAATVALITSAPEYPAPWPRFLADDERTAIPEGLPAGAIRHPKRSGPADSELLMPVAPSALPLPDHDQAITWLLFPEDWSDEALAQGIEALALQRTDSKPMLALIGDVQPSLLSLAQKLFKDRVRVVPEITAALETNDTPLVGYLGPHVLLHDRRVSKVLSMLLDDPAVVSASCVLVSTEKRGKGWHVSVAEPGSFAGASGGEDTLAKECRDAQLFWRATYPSLRPPRDLWVGRAANVAGWLQRAGPLRAHEGIQACTSLVTASYIGERDQRPAHLRPPAAAEMQALRSEALFG